MPPKNDSTTSPRTSLVDFAEHIHGQPIPWLHRKLLELLPPRRPHVVLVEREPGKPHLRIMRRLIIVEADGFAKLSREVRSKMDAAAGVPLDLLDGLPPSGLGDSGRHSCLDADGVERSILIIDDPAPVEPPTAEQLAARREFCAKHCDMGELDLPPLHWHESDVFADLLKGGGQ